MESLESYNESLTLMKNWISYKSSRTVTPVGYEELSTAAVTMKLPVLWIGTKSDSSVRAVPSPEQIAAAAQPLPIKWIEVSARTGSNVDSMQEWLFEVWDALKSREQSIHIHCLSQLSNILSTKHCKGGTLLINLETLGRCLRHGTLLKVTKFGFKQEMACFLFEKALLFCKPPNKGIYSVKKAIFLNLAVLTDSSRPANDYAFDLHSFSKSFAPTKSSSSSSKERDELTPSSSWTLLALGQADKDAWMDALTFAINGFASDMERAKYYSTLKALALASRPIQRHGRRQIGLPWSLLANNLSSGIPIIIDSLTSYLNNPSQESWGAFMLPGNAAELKVLNERANRVDVTRNNFTASTSGPASTGSMSLAQQRETVISAAPASLSASQTVAASPPPPSAGASLIGSNIQHAASGGDRAIDMTGISQLTAADFLLGFLNATPTFIPVGFFTFVIQSCQDIHLDSPVGIQHLKIAFSTLPSHIWKSLARVMFCVQQAHTNSADDSVILKVARYLQPILVKDAVEFESLNNVKLLLLIQALIRDADVIFGMPTEALASPNSAAIAAKHHYHGLSTGTSSGSSSPTGGRTGSAPLMGSAPGFGPSTPINIAASTPHIPAGHHVAATPSPRTDLSSFTPSSFTLLSFGSPTAHSTVGVATAGSVGTTIDTDFFTVTANNNHSDSQSSISELLRGMSFDSNGGVGGLAAIMATANAKKIGNFGGLARPLTANNVEGMGPLNSDQVMSRIARARAIIAELLENLKGVEMIVTAPEIEAVLQSLVITCNNLSRYNWNKYLEMIETDILEELCYILDVFDRSAKSKPIEKTLKSKQSRTHLALLAAEMSALMNQFTSYIVNLQGYDLAAPPGDRPKPRRVGGVLGVGGLGSSSNLIGSPTGPNSPGGPMSPGGTSVGGSGSPLEGDGSSGTPHGMESGEQKDLDLNTMSAKEWWDFIFGQHSLRASVEKFLAELLSVSRSTTPVLDSSSGTTPGVGTPTTTGMSAAFSAALLTSNSDDMSGSQPGTPRGGNGHATDSKHNGLSQLPLLEISQKEQKALIQFFDNQGSGFISLLKFSQFLKAFGAIPYCIEAALQVMRLPGYYGYLSTLEAIRLLETEDAGTYLLCFESNDPSNWVVHWMDEGFTHKAFSIDVSPNDYVIRPTRILVIAGVPQESASQRGIAPKSPRVSVSDTVPPILIETSPRNALSDSSATSSTATSQPPSDKYSTSTSPAPGSAVSNASSTHLRTGSNESGSTSSGDAPRIEITLNVESLSSYSSISSLVESHPLTLRQPLRSNLYNLPFFYGDISESEGMRALKGQPPGTFLIIFSANKPMMLSCLYVTDIEDRLMQRSFERQRADGQSKNGSISTSFLDAAQALDESSGAEISENFFNLAKEKDRVSVRVESGEVFENLSDAIRFYSAELKIPLTQKKSSGHVAMGSVHEGSLEKLVAYLYDDVVDLVYINAFLLTYRSFTQPPTLLEELTTQYRHLESIDNGKPYQMRLVNFFKIWLSDYSWDLVTAQDTLANIKTFVNTDISTLFPTIAKQLLNYIIKVPTEKLLEPAPQQGIVSPVPTPQTYEEPSKVWDFAPGNLAQQLFAFEFDLFSKIQPFELMGTGWMKADKHVRAPNIVRMIAKSNLIGSWIVAEILKEVNVKKRATLIEHFIAVVDESLNLNNFHSAMVVISVLRDSSIARLRLTWDRVSRKSRELLESFETKMDDEDNFAAYRAAYSQAPPPKLPYMGLVFRDLIHIEEGSPKHLPNGSINFHRCELIAEKLHLVKLSQQDRLHWPKNEDLWYYILTFPKHPDVQSQYQRSLELEPRAGTMSSTGTASPMNSRATTQPVSSIPSTPSSSTTNTAAAEERRGSRVSVFTPATPSATQSDSATTGDHQQQQTSTGSVQIPSRSASPMPQSASPNDAAVPPAGSSPTSSPTAAHNAPPRDPTPAAPDSGKWATPKKGTKPSPLANVMGFMRKK